MGHSAAIFRLWINGQSTFVYDTPSAVIGLIRFEEQAKKHEKVQLVVNQDGWSQLARKEPSGKVIFFLSGMEEHGLKPNQAASNKVRKGS